MDRRTLLSDSSGHRVVCVYSFVDFSLRELATGVIGLTAV
jgi:hypothetical protein